MEFTNDFSKNPGVFTNGVGTTTVNGILPNGTSKTEDHYVVNTPEDEKENVKEWRTEWKNFTEAVAISGMRFIVDRDLPVIRRVVWTLLVFFGAGLMTYQLVERVAHYYSYPKATVLEVKYPKRLIFPAITMCNENRVTKSGAARLGLYSMYSSLYWQYDHPNNPFPGYQWRDLDNFYANNPRNTVDWKDISTQLAPQLEYTIYTCEFDSQACSIVNTTFTYTEMGRCLTFNSDGKWKVGEAGSLNGLQITLGVVQEEYLAPINAVAGYRILAHSPDEHPDMVNKGILLSPGVGVSMEIKQVVSRLLGPPYGQCDPEARTKYIPSYTVDGCLFECLHVYLMDKCGCVHLGFSDYARNATVCDPKEEFLCIRKERNKFFKNSLSQRLCYCPPACNSTTYSYSSSQSVFSELFVSSLVTAFATAPYPITREGFLRNSLFVAINYPTVSFTTMVEEEAYDIFTLFCDMGGALGLLLGSTFLTLYEFVDFFVFTAWDVRKKKQ